MNPVIFDQADLPLEDLAAVGLVKNGQPVLEAEDLTALLSGRRTQMLRLENLEHGGMKIASLQAKLSLITGTDGKPELVLHPEYIRSTAPTYLTDTESEALESGEEKSLEKDIVDENGQRKRVLVEFDKDTKQFLQTDEDKVRAPDEINGYPLTPDQKAKFKRGEVIEVPDGTKVQYTATSRDGIRANRIGLIASILLDGGISYLLFHGLKTLTNYSADFQEVPLSDAYLNTLAKAQTQEMDDEEESNVLSTPAGQQSRGYNRSSAR